jgi:hypothetical protein
VSDPRPRALLRAVPTLLLCAALAGSAACTRADDPSPAIGPSHLAARATAPPPASAARSRPAFAPRPAFRILSGGSLLTGAGEPEPGGVLAVGDSIMLGATQALFTAFGGDITIDALVSRRFASAEEVLDGYRARGAIPETVIIDLGTNGSLTVEEFDSLMASLAGVPRVFFLTVQVPRTFEQATNDLLAAEVAKWDTAHLIDWHAIAVGHPEYVGGDGFHLTGTGVQVYADVIRSSV